MSAPHRISGMVGIAIVLAVLSCEAIAQQTKLRIYIQASTPDTTGQTFLYNIREQISRSSRYELSVTEPEALFQIRLVTLNPYGSNQTNSTVYAAVLTGTQLVPPRGTVYLQHWVGTCTIITIQSCAADLVAAVDTYVTAVYEQLVNSLRDASKK